MPPAACQRCGGPSCLHLTVSGVQSPAMTQQGETEQSHVERQTKALEDIRGVLLFLLALAIVGAVLGLAAFVNG
jgi:hypothetical protein